MLHLRISEDVVCIQMETSQGKRRQSIFKFTDLYALLQNHLIVGVCVYVSSHRFACHSAERGFSAAGFPVEWLELSHA